MRGDKEKENMAASMPLTSQLKAHILSDPSPQFILQLRKLTFGSLSALEELKNFQASLQRCPLVAKTLSP